MIAAITFGLAILVALAWVPHSPRVGTGEERDPSAGRLANGETAAGPVPLPKRRHRPGANPLHFEVDAVEALDLIEAALGSGASLPRALESVGKVCGGEFGAAMTSITGALAMGASWEDAWAMVEDRGFGLEEILEHAWSGAPARALVARAAERARRSRATRAAESAQRLGVTLVLPLGICFLPAFILITVVPVIIAFVSGLM